MLYELRLEKDELKLTDVIRRGLTLGVLRGTACDTSSPETRRTPCAPAAIRAD